MKVLLHFFFVVPLFACIKVATQDSRLLVSPLLMSRQQHVQVLNSGELGSIFGESCVVAIGESEVLRLRKALIGSGVPIREDYDLEDGPEFSILDNQGRYLFVYSSNFFVDFDGVLYEVEQSMLGSQKKTLDDIANYPGCLEQ
jgi:hypothetical protein